MAASSSSQTAQKTFDLENNVQMVDADSIFRYDVEEQRRLNEERPWKKDPHYFRNVRISSIALIKMVMHARSGGAYEIMGLMQGKIDGDTFVVMDAFALPVQGTETRVNAANEANEFMVEYIEQSKHVDRPENIVGWYHSHPGYRCWLSGIDVSTQIDPNRTVSAGRVDIGAFRTYPDGYTPAEAQSYRTESIPLSKIEDFGVHSARYYPLNISHFKSNLDTKILDLLWNKYWAMTLSQSPLVTNRAYLASRLSDLSDKLSRSDPSFRQRASLPTLSPHTAHASANRKAGNDKGAPSKKPTARPDENSLNNLVKESDSISSECSHGLMAQILKQAIFDTTSQQKVLDLSPVT